MISCENYDYVEIVCMFRYPIKVYLKSGNHFQGVALDTQRNYDKEECIKMRGENGESELIVLDSILKLEVCVKNPHFNEVYF